MPLARFEPTFPVSELPQTHALDRAATGTGIVFIFSAQYQALLRNPAVSFLCSGRSITMYILASFNFLIKMP